MILARLLESFELEDALEILALLLILNALPGNVRLHIYVV